MHTLHLLRHAKSMQNDDVDDRERALSRRGRDAAVAVGRHLPTAVGMLDLVLASSALRTRQTLDLVLAGFSVRPRCLVEDQLYLASAAQLLQRLRLLPEDARNVLLIGHNPGLHDLALTLAAPASPAALPLVSGKFPTAARVSFRFDAIWQTLGRDRVAPLAYVTPKSLPGGKD